MAPAQHLVADGGRVRLDVADDHLRALDDHQSGDGAGIVRRAPPAPAQRVDLQLFDAVRKVAKIGSPLLVVHGGEDHLILPDLGRKLFAAAAEPKLFVLVEGGSHHDTNQVGQPQYKAALAQLFTLN